MLKLFIGLTLALLPLSAGASYGPEFALDGVHAAPATFIGDGAGGFFGTTVAGQTFIQRPAANAFGHKLQKCAIGDTCFYIGKYGAFTAHSDLADVSIYLSQC